MFHAIVKRVAANVRRLRRERGWTQQRAAVAAEMAKYQLQRVESGRYNVTATTLARLCDAFGVDVVDLVKPLDTEGR